MQLLGVNDQRVTDDWRPIINVVFCFFMKKKMAEEGATRKPPSGGAAPKKEGCSSSDGALVVSLEEANLFLPAEEQQKATESVARDGSKGLEITMDACFKSFDKDE